MDQEGIVVGKRMEFEHQVISDFLSRKMSRVQASEMLGVRERTISRKVRRLEKSGLHSLVHGNKGRSPPNKILDSKKREVMMLVESGYFDFNMIHCLEILKAEHHLEVGYDSLRRWSHAKHLFLRVTSEAFFNVTLRKKSMGGPWLQSLRRLSLCKVLQVAILPKGNG